jgi:hypothetical protein
MVRTTLDRLDAVIQGHLTWIPVLLIVANLGGLLFFLVTGKINLRGNIISRRLEPGRYSLMLGIFVVLMIFACVIFATGK